MERVFSPKYQRTNGKEAWRNNMRLAVYAADKIHSTLGPKGAHKLVYYNRGPERVIKVTKDAIAILDELAIQYPPVVIVAESAKILRQETGDGVATFVVLLSALIKKADELMNLRIHPNTIVHGYHLATEKALETLNQQATNRCGDILDTLDCGRNLLTSKLRAQIREAYPLAFCEGRFEPENVGFLRQSGGALEDSTLIRGVVVKREKAHPNMPDYLSNLRIVLTSERLGFDRLEIKMQGQGPNHIKLNIKSADQLQKFKETEVKLKTRGIEKLSELRVNVLLCQQPIEEYQKTMLLANGVFAVERVDKKDIDGVAKATGAKVVGNLKQLSEEDIGVAKQLYTGRVELEKTVTFEGCSGATFLLRGNVPQVIDELETAIKNSLTVLKLTSDDPRVLPGGGAVEAYLTQELKSYAKMFQGKEQIAIEAFAEALMDIPRYLADNYGLSSIDTLSELKNHQADGECNFGVCGHSCAEWVCLEPLKVKRSVILRASEVVTLMLKIDELIMSKKIPKFHKK